MPKGTDRIPDRDALLRFANSDTGKSLLGRLEGSDPQKLKTAAEKASSGDIAGAMKILQGLLSTAEDGRKQEEPHG